MFVRGNGQLINAGELRRLRFDAGLSQAELSRASGVGQSYISQLELGRRRVVHPKTARKLALALRVAPQAITLAERRLPKPTQPTARRGGTPTVAGAGG